MDQGPDILVDLVTANTSFEADVIVQALESAGIPARTFTLAAAVLTWEIAATRPIRVAVRRQDLELARATLENVRLEAAEIDWENVDTRDAAQIASGVAPDQGDDPIGKSLAQPRETFDAARSAKLGRWIVSSILLITAVAVILRWILS